MSTPESEHLKAEIIRERFNSLAEQWRGVTRGQSVIHWEHPANQEIIGMGPDILPLILSELDHNTGHWFGALRAISGINPVPDEEAGHIKKMRQRWLEWGQKEGLYSRSDKT